MVSFYAKFNKLFALVMGKEITVLIVFIFGFLKANCQDIQSTWKVRADTINPANYHGVTVANGMVGLVSSAEPLQIQDIVLNGVYDYYGRGRVSNILKGFNFYRVGHWSE